MKLFTDDELILEKLSAKGNPLERLDAVIDWELFRPTLNRIFSNPDKDPKKGGRPHHDYLLMFKTLLLQRLYNLSDDAMEYQLLDRLSFRRFVGCSEDTIPDAKTIWLYKERLTQSGQEQTLFDVFYNTLESNGYIAHKGQIVDASFVHTPVQRNPRDENEDIKNGNTPKHWKKNKRSQKDVDANWTQKGGQRHFGYKNHISVDSKSKLIKKFQISPASLHDSNILEELCDQNEPVFDDSAYRAKPVPEGCQHHTCRRAVRNKPLTETDKKVNRMISRTRSRVEHVFGFIKNSMGSSFFRRIGISRAHTHLVITNLLYNICRFEQIERLGLKTWA